MALIRRCARLLWIRTKFVRLNENHRNYIFTESNPTNMGYVLQFQTQTRTNSQYESNPPSTRPSSDSHRETNTAHDHQALLEPYKTRSMCYADVKRLVNKKRKDLPLSEESFGLHLLESCRDMLPDADLKARRELVHQVWNMLEDTGQTLTVEHYNVLLSVYAQNSQYLNAEEFLRTMKITPDKDTYRLLLDAVAEIGDYAQILSIMTKTKDMGYPINEDTFNSLILAYSINADVDGAQSVIVTMQTARIEPSAATYCALARGFAVKGDLRNLELTLKTKNWNTKQLMMVVKSLSSSGHGEYISRVMKYLPNIADTKNDDVVCTIVELTHLGKTRDALEIINYLPVPEKTTDSLVSFADIFLYEMVKSETPMQEILEICESLRTPERNSSALLKVTEAALRLKKEDMAIEAFQALRNHGIEIRPHFYWPLLTNAVSNNRTSDVLRLIKHMIDNKVYLDDETLQNYTIPFLPTRDPLMVVRQLQDCGVKISQILTPLLATLLSNGNVKGAITLTDNIKGKIDGDIVIKHLVHGYLETKNVDAVTKLLYNIDSSSDQNGTFLLNLLANERVTVTNEELGSLVFAFDKKKLKISKSCAESLEPKIMRLKESKDLLEILKRLINPESGTPDYRFIPHPRDMTAEELENHLADLTTKGMNTRGVLRKLIQVHCGENNLRKAEKFVELFTSKGFEWTTGMTAGMFTLYAAHNMLDEAEIRYKELREKHKGFRIDDHKIIDYATALVNNKKLEKALEVLGEQENIKHRPETIRNCSRLLNAVAASGNVKNMKRTLNLLTEKGYCEISNHVLGPLIRTHLSNGDLQAAVAEFKECAHMHRKVPLQQELLRAIVQTCNDKPEAQKQLGTTLAIIKSIHGDNSANSQLFMALAATNKQKELHILMKMPAVNQATLNTSAQRLTDEKDLSAFKTILRACRGVRKLDNTIIYDSILTLCSRAGDYQTALEIWEKIQSEEADPSPRLVQKLKDLLKAHSVSLPSELLLRKGKKKG